jgi:hypothetical protein
VQSDGKILVAASLSFPVTGSMSQFGLARLNGDGSYDGNYLTSPTPFSSTNVQEFESIGVRPDGTSVVSYLGNPYIPSQATFSATGIWDAAAAAPRGVPLASGGWVHFTFPDPKAQTLQVTVLNSDQSIANSYVVDLVPPAADLPYPQFSDTVTAFDDKGRLLVAAAS